MLSKIKLDRSLQFSGSNDENYFFQYQQLYQRDEIRSFRVSIPMAKHFNAVDQDAAQNENK
jgi:hypothetical protein